MNKINPNTKQKILFIYPRKGLFQITKCSSCGFNYQCQNCDANLITYRKWEKNLQLLCHQCQSYYSYPTECSSCGENKILSMFGGIEKLCEELQEATGINPIRLDQKNLKQLSDSIYFVTTRIYNPGIDYNQFSKIVFIASDNLLSSPDYMVIEEVVTNIAKLLLASNVENIIFDVLDIENEFFQEIAKLKSKQDILNWYFNRIKIESKNREKFNFPPFQNLILITSQEKNKDLAMQKPNKIAELLKQYKLNDFPEIQISSVYPARFLKRKKHFSYHLLVRYPKRYKKIFELQRFIQNQTIRLNLQVRHNPKNLF
jgi:primosomal protein N' (replication factor Y) (superfamily II helicase)